MFYTGPINKQKTGGEDSYLNMSEIALSDPYLTACIRFGASKPAKALFYFPAVSLEMDSSLDT